MKRQVKKIVHKGFCMLLAGIAVLTASVSLTACVDQHPDGQGSSTGNTSNSAEVRLVATSPAVAQICDKLELDLVGVCRTSGTLPERYKDVTQVGTAMSPDMEILKSLSPDYVLSPNSLPPPTTPAGLTDEICGNPGEIPVFKFKKCIRHVCFNCRSR